VWQEGSVHRSAWPRLRLEAPRRRSCGSRDRGGPCSGQVRKAKTAARLSIRAEASRVVVQGPDEAVVRASESDLRAAGNIADFSFQRAPELGTEVTLAEAVAS